MTTTTFSLPRQTSSNLTFFSALFQWESIAFAVICVADMLTTLHWVHLGMAKEANPLLAKCLEQGDAVFILAKLASFVPMLCLTAWYRTKQPKFITTALRIAIAAYLTFYVIGVGSQFIKL